MATVWGQAVLDFRCVCLDADNLAATVAAREKPMCRRVSAWLCVVMALAGPLNARAAPSAEELADKNVQARGGAAALSAMKSLRLTGRMIVNGGQFELAFVQTVLRPGFVRNEATVQGLTQVQAWNGMEGWQIDPFQGRKDPERLSADDVKSLVETAADFDGPLVDWRAKGHVLAYLGTEDIDGTLAHKIRLTRRNGDTEVVWLDPDMFLEIRLLSQRIERGSKVETEVDMGDYEQVSGVLLPMAVDFGRKGADDKQKFIVKRAEVNPAVDERVFAFPATAAKPAR
jgi:hypothetical protein